MSAARPETGATKHRIDLESGLVISTRAYLDALEALIEAGSSIGVSDGRYAAEGLWQDAENARDAAREEMGE